MRQKKVLDLAISGSHFCFFQMTWFLWLHRLVTHWSDGLKPHTKWQKYILGPPSLSATELPVLHIERSQLRWFRHLTRTSPVFWALELEGDSGTHKRHAIEMMSLSWLTNTFDSHQMGWRSLSRCVKVHDALIILHNKQDSPCVKAMRPLLLLSSTLIVWWNLPQTPGWLCKWLILTFRLFSKALSSVSGAYWLASHSNWSRWRVQVALVQMAHYLQHIALTAAAASFTQTVSMWLSPADLNLLMKTQWAHFKSSSLRSRSAAGLKREVLKWLC